MPKRPPTRGNIETLSMSSLPVPMGITKSPLHLPSTATLALRNLGEPLMPPLALVATWDINTSRSVKAKVMTPRLAQMLVMPKQRMTAGTQRLTAALCHAYVSIIALICLLLTVLRSSSMHMSCLKMLFRKVYTAPCTIRPGIAHTVPTMGSTVDLIVTPCRSLTATPRRK